MQYIAVKPSIHMQRVSSFVPRNIIIFGTHFITRAKARLCSTVAGSLGEFWVRNAMPIFPLLPPFLGWCRFSNILLIQFTTVFTDLLINSKKICTSLVEKGLLFKFLGKRIFSWEILWAIGQPKVWHEGRGILFFGKLFWRLFPKKKFIESFTAIVPECS